MLSPNIDNPRQQIRVLVLSLLVLLAACAPNSDAGAPADDKAEGAASSSASAEAPPASAAPVDSSDDTRSVARRVADAALAAQVQQALLDTAALRPFTFDVNVRNSRVALRGSVHTHAQRQLAGTVAGGVEGIEQLFNEVAVLDTTRTRPDTSSSAPQE